MHTPPALKKGDKIGIVAPAGKINKERWGNMKIINQKKETERLEPIIREEKIYIIPLGGLEEIGKNKNLCRRRTL